MVCLIDGGCTFTVTLMGDNKEIERFMKENEMTQEDVNQIKEECAKVEAKPYEIVEDDGYEVDIKGNDGTMLHMMRRKELEAIKNLSILEPKPISVFKCVPIDYVELKSYSLVFYLMKTFHTHSDIHKYCKLEKKDGEVKFSFYIGNVYSDNTRLTAWFDILTNTKPSLLW